MIWREKEVKRLQIAEVDGGAYGPSKLPLACDRAPVGRKSLADDCPKEDDGFRVERLPKREPSGWVNSGHVTVTACTS